MTIEKVRLLKTLKAGSKVYLKGEEFASPEIDEILLNEVRIGARTVKVLKYKKAGPSLKLIRKKVVDEEATISTLAGITSNLLDEEKIAPSKPKTKLVKRKGK